MSRVTHRGKRVGPEEEGVLPPDRAAAGGRHHPRRRRLGLPGQGGHRLRHPGPQRHLRRLELPRPGVRRRRRLPVRRADAGRAVAALPRHHLAGVLEAAPEPRVDPGRPAGIALTERLCPGSESRSDVDPGRRPPEHLGHRVGSPVQPRCWSSHPIAWCGPARGDQRPGPTRDAPSADRRRPRRDHGRGRGRGRASVVVEPAVELDAADRWRRYSTSRRSGSTTGRRDCRPARGRPWARSTRVEVAVLEHRAGDRPPRRRSRPPGIAVGARSAPAVRGRRATGPRSVRRAWTALGDLGERRRSPSTRRPPRRGRRARSRTRAGEAFQSTRWSSHPR